MQFNLYIALLTLSFVISVLVTVVTYSKRKTVNGGGYFFLMMIAVSLWSFAGAMEQSVTRIELKIFWSVVCYISIPLIPVLFYVFVLKFIQSGKDSTIKNERFFYIYPVVIFTLAATNHWHYWLWSEITPVHSAGGVTAKYGHGPLFFTVVVTTYLIVALNIFHLWRANTHFKSIFKKQVRLLLLAQLLPIAINSLYVFWGEIIDYVDPTPIAFTLTGILIAYSIFKYSFLDLVPVARNIMFDNLAEGVLLVDDSERIVDVNNTFISFFGERDLIGKNFRDEFSSIPALVQLGESDQNEKIEFSYNKMSFSAISLNISNTKKESHGKLVSILDVTELKIKEETLLNKQAELKEINSAKDKLLSIIAHDLKNPFFGIIGLSDIVIEDFDELKDDEKMKFLHDINQVAKDTFKMLENLLDWSRQQTGMMVFEPGNFDINEVIKTIIEAYRPHAVIKSIKLEVELLEGLTVFADINMIKTVLRNLVTNAVKFTKPGGRIIIKSELVSDYAVIKVIDDGVGISDEDMKKLFRIDESLRTIGTLGEKGTGLGLLLCHDFVEQNGGTIAAEQNPDAGTTFSFTLPLVKEMDSPEK